MPISDKITSKLVAANVCNASRAAGRFRLAIDLLQNAADQLAGVGFVIDNQHASSDFESDRLFA